MGKGYIPLFFDLFDETEDLTDEEFGRLIRAAGSYASGKDDWIDIVTGNEKYAFRFLRGQIDRNIEISKARARARLGKKEQPITNDNKAEQNGTKLPKEKEKEKDKEKNKDKEVVRKFIPPTVDEVALYCSERHNHVNAGKFVDYYSSNGWRVGKNPMKDWKACVRTWERSEFTEKDYQYELLNSGLPY